jgi:transcriptional regulator with XRE-family HTH domain
MPYNTRKRWLKTGSNLFFTAIWYIWNMNAENMKQKHHGHNVKRIREIVGKKQADVGNELGIGQQGMSQIEQREVIDDELMERIAEILKVPGEAIRNFDEEKAINIISNNSFENCDQPASVFYNSNINPVDKWMDAIKKNEDLYQQLLQSEKEKVELLKTIVDKFKL